MKSFKFIVLVCLVLLIGAGLVGCMPSTGVGKTASIFLNLGFKNAKDIAPPAGSLVCSNYHITGTGPQSATFTVDTAVSTTVSGLLPGHWVVSVDGQNASGVAIGHGSAAGDLMVGQTLNLAITVSELAGNGTADITLTWEPNIVGAPVWTGTFQGFTGAPITMLFNTNTAACTSESVTTGMPARILGHSVPAL